MSICQVGYGYGMKILLLQLDGKIPNIALMRIAAHHRALGDDVELRWASRPDRCGRLLWEQPDKVYASAIFEKSRPSVAAVKRQWPNAIVGGTGIDLTTTLEQHGITTKAQDYSDYPNWRQSIGFTQRGCRLKCWFCVVPKKEGAVKHEQTIADLWRGDPWPRELVLLDNDFFGNPQWRARIEEIRIGKFKVSFNQGINARMLSDEAAEAIASVEYRDDSMKVRRIYTAWDNIGDEGPLFRGLRALVRYGVKPDHIMVYVLIGAGEDEENRLTRVRKLLEFGARPYPMPFVRNRETVGFQRWVVGAYAKRIAWKDWKAAGFRPERLDKSATVPPNYT